MGQAAVKKDGHLKKVVSGRVSLKIHAEVMRRAAAERRTVSVWLELLLEKYFQENPVLQIVPSEEFVLNEENT